MPTRIIFFGEVQGVCFRQYCLKEAKKLGLKGYVKNLPDGTVEVVTDGKVDELIEYCKHQPYARVEKTKVSEVQGKFETFEVLF